MTRKLTITILFLLAAVLLVGVFKWYAWSPVRQWEAKAVAMVGCREAEFIATLGQPQHVVTAASLAGRSVDYPWQGMGFVPVPRRSVQNKVLLYSKIDVALYVYIDERGIVEHVAVAGT